MDVSAIFWFKKGERMLGKEADFAEYAAASTTITINARNSLSKCYPSEKHTQEGLSG